MKKLMLALCLVAGASFAADAQQKAAPQQQAAPAKDNKNAPKFKFLSGETHDFGTLSEGPSAEYTFEFQNTGKEPLIIQNAHASCGCTVPEWPKEPIMPGKKGKLKVTYNTQGKSGPFMKTVFIKSNAVSEKAEYELYIKGSVTPANGGTQKG